MLSRYLLDTNIWSHLQRRSSPQLTERFNTLQAQQICMSVIVRGELETGYLKGDRSPQRRQSLNFIVAGSQLLEMSQGVAEQYANIRTALEKAGTPIGPNDTWIAAEALHHKLILVSDNGRAFERVAGLKVENWL